MIIITDVKCIKACEFLEKLGSKQVKLEDNNDPYEWKSVNDILFDVIIDTKYGYAIRCLENIFMAVQIKDETGEWYTIPLDSREYRKLEIL